MNAHLPERLGGMGASQLYSTAETVALDAFSTICRHVGVRRWLSDTRHFRLMQHVVALAQSKTGAVTELPQAVVRCLRDNGFSEEFIHCWTLAFEECLPWNWLALGTLQCRRPGTSCVSQFLSGVLSEMLLDQQASSPADPAPIVSLLTVREALRLICTGLQKEAADFEVRCATELYAYIRTRYSTFFASAGVLSQLDALTESLSSASVNRSSCRIDAAPAAQLSIGIGAEFLLGEGNDARLLRVVWKSASSGWLTLVNEKGEKVLETTQRRLIDMLRTKELSRVSR